MNYVGVDIQKRYSVLVAVDERGRELGRSRSNGNTAFGFAQFFGGLEGKSKVVLEARWNWGRIYDLLSEIEQVEEVVLAHPLKTRLIADAQIKTDGLDAHALATLLRGDLIARAHVPAQTHAPAQGSVASAIVLGAATDAHSQSHSRADRSATRTKDAPVQRSIWAQRSHCFERACLEPAGRDAAAGRTRVARADPGSNQGAGSAHRRVQ